MRRFGDFFRIPHARGMIYEVECPSCRTSFSFDSGSASSTLATCPQCGKRFRPSKK